MKKVIFSFVSLGLFFIFSFSSKAEGIFNFSNKDEYGKYCVEIDDWTESPDLIKNYTSSKSTVMMQDPRNDGDFRKEVEVKINEVLDQGGSIAIKQQIQEQLSLLAIKEDFNLKNKESEIQNLQSYVDLIKTPSLEMERINLLSISVYPASHHSQLSLMSTQTTYVNDDGEITIKNYAIVPIWMNSAQKHFTKAIVLNSPEEYRQGKNLILLSHFQQNQRKEGFVFHIHQPDGPSFFESFTPMGDAASIQYRLEQEQYFMAGVETGLAFLGPIGDGIGSIRKIPGAISQGAGFIATKGDEFVDAIKNFKNSDKIDEVATVSSSTKIKISNTVADTTEIVAFTVLKNADDYKNIDNLDEVLDVMKNNPASNAKPPKNFTPPKNEPQIPEIPFYYTQATVAQNGSGIILGGTLDDIVNGVDTIRIMAPNDIYPNGYWVSTNAKGELIDISTDLASTLAQDVHNALPPGYWEELLGLYN